MEQKVTKKKWLQVEDIVIAYQHLKDIVTHTPLQKNERLSEKYNCNLYLKREDLQVVRSFKLRGAYYAMKMLPQEKLGNGVICAPSALCLRTVGHCRPAAAAVAASCPVAGWRLVAPSVA